MKLFDDDQINAALDEFLAACEKRGFECVVLAADSQERGYSTHQGVEYGRLNEASTLLRIASLPRKNFQNLCRQILDIHREIVLPSESQPGDSHRA